LLAGPLIAQAESPSDWQNSLFNDSHFHLTIYVQEGTCMEQLVTMMGDRISPSTFQPRSR